MTDHLLHPSTDTEAFYETEEAEFFAPVDLTDTNRGVSINIPEADGDTHTDSEEK